MLQVRKTDMRTCSIHVFGKDTKCSNSRESPKSRLSWKQSSPEIPTLNPEP